MLDMSLDMMRLLSLQYACVTTTKKRVNGILSVNCQKMIPYTLVILQIMFKHQVRNIKQHVLLLALDTRHELCYIMFSIYLTTFVLSI